MNYLGGIKISSSSLCISHMFFADDTLIFLQATQQNCRNIVEIFQAYCAALGQHVSLNKSSVYFSAYSEDNYDGDG